MDYELIELAGRFGAYKGLTESTVSTYICGNGDAISRLKRGHSMTIRRAKRLLQNFSDEWPSGLPWPSDIPRPEPQLENAAQ